MKADVGPAAGPGSEWVVARHVVRKATPGGRSV